MYYMSLLSKQRKHMSDEMARVANDQGNAAIFYPTWPGFDKDERFVKDARND